MAERKNNKKIVKVVDIIRISESKKPKKPEPENDFFAEDTNGSKAISELEELVRSKDEFRQIEEEKPIKKTKKAKKALAWSGILIIIAFGIYLAFSVLPKADIEIVTKKVNWDSQATLTVNKNLSQPDVSSLQIPGEIINQPKNVVLQFTPTGTKYVERKASGTVTIYNAFNSSPQVLVATTRLQTPDGKIYRLVNKITVPGAKVVAGKITPSSLPDVQVVADKAGPDYNVGPVEKLTIPGFSGTPRFEGFYASIPTGISGGFIGNGLYPTDSDIAKAKDQTQTALNEALMSVFLTLPQDYTYVSSTVSNSTTKITVNTTMDANNQFSAVGDGQVKLVIFREADVIDVLRQLAQKDASLPQDYVEKSKTLTYNNPTVDWKLSKMTLPLNYSAVYWHPIDVGQLTNAVAGKSSTDLKSYVLNLPGVDKVSVSFWPFWVNSVPSKTNKINITVE